MLPYLFIAMTNYNTIGTGVNLKIKSSYPFEARSGWNPLHIERSRESVRLSNYLVSIDQEPAFVLRELNVAGKLNDLHNLVAHLCYYCHKQLFE